MIQIIKIETPSCGYCLQKKSLVGRTMNCEKKCQPDFTFDYDVEFVEKEKVNYQTRNRSKVRGNARGRHHGDFSSGN